MSREAKVVASAQQDLRSILRLALRRGASEGKILSVGLALARNRLIHSVGEAEAYAKEVITKAALARATRDAAVAPERPRCCTRRPRGFAASELVAPPSWSWIGRMLRPCVAGRTRPLRESTRSVSARG